MMFAAGFIAGLGFVVLIVALFGHVEIDRDI